MNPLNLHPDKKDSIFILIIFVLAIFLRLAYLADYRSTDIYPLLQDSDSQAYYNWGRDIASGDVLGSRAFMKWPLYAYFLAFFIKLSPANTNPTV